MQHYIGVAVIVIVSYIIGSLSGAIILTKIFKFDDIRNSGSKNAGTTNMLRVHGKKAAIMTLIIDILKGVVAVLMGMVLENRISYFYVIPEELQGVGKYLAAVFVVLGHIFPVFFKFKGGKGVATSLGVIICLDWRVGLVVMAVALTIMALTKYVSLGSVLGALIFPILMLLFMMYDKPFPYIKIICCVILAFIVIIKHSSNIKRLITGTENKLSFSKK